MSPQQHSSAYSSLASSKMSITRRGLIKNILQASISTAAITTLLTGCSYHSTQLTSSKAHKITWWHEYDGTKFYKQLVDKFKDLYDIEVKEKTSQDVTDLYHNDMQQALSCKQEIPDVCSLDVIWISEFANDKWFLPFFPEWTTSWKDKYLDKSLEAVTYNDRIWAAPFRIDIGLLFYRPGLSGNNLPVPTTWGELENQAQKATERGYVDHGYLWSGEKNENLVCQFLEVLSSSGGHLLDPNDPQKVSLDTNEAEEALSRIKMWLQTISPGMTKQNRLSIHTLWKEGEAAFMREWPSSIAEFYKKDNKIFNNFSVAALPGSPPEYPGRSCLGGWNLAISATSPNQEDAWRFVSWMMQETTQYMAVTQASFAPTLREAYTIQDKTLQDANPFFSKFKPIMENAVLRPQTPHYHALSSQLQTGLYQVLHEGQDVRSTLKQLQKDLQKILSSGATPPIPRIDCAKTSAPTTRPVSSGEDW